VAVAVAVVVVISNTTSSSAVHVRSVVAKDVQDASGSWNIIDKPTK